MKLSNKRWSTDEALSERESPLVGTSLSVSKVSQCADHFLHILLYFLLQSMGIEGGGDSY